MKQCRICLDSEGQLISIFATNSRVALRIFQISGIHVIETGDLPALICRFCLKDLYHADRFRKKCIESAEAFLSKIPEKFFDKSRLETEKEDDGAARISEIASYDFESTTAVLGQQVDVIEPKPENIRRQYRNVNFRKKKDPDLYFCSQCMKTYKSRDYLAIHERIKHQQIDPGDMFKCDVCGYLGKTKPNMRFHMSNRHLTKTVDKFICRTCGKPCKSPGALYCHELTHVEVDPSCYSVCNFCQKAFKHKRLLIQHQKLVHERSKTVNCPHCDHVSTCNGALKTHIRTVHLKEKNHVCSDCPAAFFQKSALIRHIRIHTGERPFQCTNEGCQRFYPDKNGRKKHMRVCPLKPVTN